MSNRYDVIPDIHADIDRLERTLDALGGGATLAFLGDFIDAGTATREADDAAVLTRVRQLVVERGAVAVMGNHELNAILFHTLGKDGIPLRTHSDKNKAQHRSFERQFGISTPQAKVWVDWFTTLPLWLDLGGLRLVHACWSQPDIDLIRKRRPDGCLSREDFPEIAAEETDFAKAVKNLVTGPELPLPEEHQAFQDAGGHPRRQVRIAWWRSTATTWQDAALSVPTPSELPDGDLPQNRDVTFYPVDAKPVLTGHYKMTGKPTVETSNAACLDFPADPCAYRWNGETRLTDDRLLVV